MDIVGKRLRELGFEVKRGNKTGKGADELERRVIEANKWKADIYYVAHTNAGGGRYSMTMCYPSTESKAKANVIHKYRKCISSHKVTTRKDLYEINATSMICLYDELFFHDNATDCKWYHNGGHVHEDKVSKTCYPSGALSFPIITTRCDAAQENDSTLIAERVTGTTTEQSFDVFTVNKKTRKIYATKIGAGADREIGY